MPAGGHRGKVQRRRNYFGAHGAPYRRWSRAAGDAAFLHAGFATVWVADRGLDSAGARPRSRRPGHAGQSREIPSCRVHPGWPGQCPYLPAGNGTRRGEEIDIRLQCPVTKGKKACYYRYTDKDIRLARRRKEENSPTFREKYRYRAGVEATMSEFDRRTGVKHIRVRGMKAVRFAAIMKAIGLNILRASRHRGRKNNPRGSHRGFLWLLLAGWSLFKELFWQ